MRKTILTFAAAAISLAASAYTISTPTTWTEDFVEMSKEQDHPFGEWITYGNGAAVPDIEQQFFPSTDGPYFVFLDQGSKTYCMATTDFVNGAQADQWLVSPEVEIPYDNMTIAFNVASYTAAGQIGNSSSSTYGTHPYKIMISESGSADKEAFTELYSGSVKNQMSQQIETAERVINVNGYNGKKVRFAFVVTGSNTGMTGITNIRLGQYTFYVTDDLNAELAEVGKPISIDYNTKLKCPVVTPYLKTVLYINDEKVAEENYKKAFGSVTSYVTAIQRIKFPDVYTPTSDDALKYRLELTPDFEGAIPTVIEGGFGFPKFTYLNNVVVEEMTGSSCGFCTRGIAALEYYHDKYPGSETQGKVINIGIHSTGAGPDPMAAGVERYVTSLAELNGATGLPGAVFNRSSQGKDPVAASEVERQIANTSYNHAKIVKVEMPDGYTDEVIGKKMYVTVEVKNGYDSELSNLSMAVVLLENNVKSNSSSYNQTNYLARYNSGRDAYAAFISLGPVEEMSPYFNQFCAAGELGNETIAYSKMTYQHVARGIYPSFAGEALSTSWTADVPQTYTIEVEIPSNVFDAKNFEVVALVFNNASRGAIVASDNMDASEFTSMSGVEGIEAEASAIKAYNEGGMLKVVAPAGSVAEVYTLDGVKLGNYVVADGALTVDAALNGAMLVKVASNDEVKTFKLIF